MTRGDDLTDEQFLRLCRVEAMRGPGPGGQKRNKTSSYIRITHELSGISATAGELRSQSRNKIIALQRLRVKVAIAIREPIDLARFALPDWFIEKTRGSQTIGPRSSQFAMAIGLMLDVLAAHADAIGPTRETLNFSSRQMMAMLQAESSVFAAVQEHRAARGLHPLRGE